MLTVFQSWKKGRRRGEGDSLLYREESKVFCCQWRERERESEFGEGRGRQKNKGKKIENIFLWDLWWWVSAVWGCRSDDE